MLKIVIVGSGWWGSELARAAHAEARRTPDRIALGGICSLQAAEAEALCAQLGGQAYADYASVLADTSVHAVVLATPHSLHETQVTQAAAASKHVFVEKPLALNRASAERAIHACQQGQRVLAVGHNRRFMPGAQQLRQLIDSGALGQIVHVEANYSGNLGLKLPATHWRTQREEMPAAGLAPMGLHWVDTVQWLLGPIARLASIGKRQVTSLALDDTSVTLFELENGIPGVLASNLAHTLTAELRIYGTKARAEVRNNFSQLTVEPQANNDSKVSQGSNTQGPWHYPPPQAAGKASAADPSLCAELAAFADSCLEGVPYPVSTQDAVRNVAVMQAIAASAAERGAWQSLP